MTELDRQVTVDHAGSPQAIASPVTPKEPISDNDPERNVSAPQRITGTILLIFGFAFLAVLSALTLLLFL